jgi:hypothetical protein
MTCWNPYCPAEADVLLLLPAILLNSSHTVPRCAFHSSTTDGGTPMFFFQEQVTAYLVAERLANEL